MPPLPALILCIACALTCVRVLIFRRTGKRYRWHISALAWVLAASSGSIALDVLLYGGAQVTWGEAGIASVLCALTCLARGNVAHITRINRDH